MRCVCVCVCVCVFARAITERKTSRAALQFLRRFLFTMTKSQGVELRCKQVSGKRRNQKGNLVLIMLHNLLPIALVVLKPRLLFRESRPWVQSSRLLEPEAERGGWKDSISCIQRVTVTGACAGEPMQAVHAGRDSNSAAA